MINILLQTAYRIYKWCSSNEDGNEKSMVHAESNDDLINHLQYNSAWKQESLVATCNRRALFRFSDVESSLTLDSTSKPSCYHNMDIIDEKYESKSMCGRKKTYVCRWCSLDEGKTLKTSRAYRTSWFCIECSMLLAKDEEKVYLHPGCFGKYHNMIEVQNALGWC